MSEDDERITLGEVPSIADLRFLDQYRAQQNGSLRDELWRPIDLAQVPDVPPAQPNLGGLGIAYRGKRHVFSGPQESAKTLAAYVLGLQILRLGGAFCLIDFEMGRWEARNRLRELGASAAELAQIIYYEPEGRMPERVPGDVIDTVGGRDALVLLDAAAGAFAFEELDDNKRMDVEKFGARYVEPFRRAGIATLVLDHVVKSSEARGNYAIGSERKVGATDVHLGFTVVHPIKRGGSGTYKITTHKDRGGFLKRGKLADFELHSDPETHAISWAFNVAVETDDEHPFRPTVLMEKVSRYLEGQLEAVRIGDVKDTITGKAEYVVEAVRILVDEGFVSESIGARGSRLLESISPFRESYDRPVPDPFPPVPETGHSTRSPFPSLRGNGSGDDLEDGNGSQHSLDDDIPF